MCMYSQTEDFKIYETEKTKLIIIDGYAVNEDGSFPKMKLTAGGSMLDFSMVRMPMKEVTERYSLPAQASMCGFRLVSKTQQPFSHLVLSADDKELLSKDEKAIRENTIRSGVVYYIDYSYIDENKAAAISGWAFAVDGGDVSYSIVNGENQEISYKVRTYPRIDQPSVNGNEKENHYGFRISFVSEGNEKVVLTAGGYKESFSFDPSGAIREDDSQLARLRKKVNDSSVERLKRYYRQNGLLRTVRKVINTARGVDAYHQWFVEHRTPEKELRKQRDVRFAYAPLISVVVPTFNTPEKYLHEMIGSLLNQTYTNWQLCIADGSEPESKTRDLLNKYVSRDSRIKVTYLDQNYGISGNTNKALELADGEYTGLFDHDDILEPDCLFEIVQALQNIHYDVIYTDEDKLNSRSGRYEAPCFKPDFDLFLIRSENYITHFFVSKTELIRKAGGFHSEYDGSQDFDLTLRCIEQAENICHIPKILYHWRMHGASTAEDPTSKLYCYESGEKALHDHFERTGIKADVAYAKDPLWGTYHVRYKTTNPRITAVLRNYSNEDAANECISLLKSGYSNLEVLTADNESANLADILNEAAEKASGEYILYLDGVIPDTKGSLSYMTGCIEQEGVCVVAGKAVDSYNLISSSSLIIGLGEGYVDGFRGMSRSGPGVFNKAVVNCECSAVPGSCFLIRKQDLEKAGYFDPVYQTDACFADVCMKIRNMGGKVVYNPYAEWILKSEIRGDTDKTERDMQVFRMRFRNEIGSTDPYYNKNYDMKGGPYSL